MTPVLLDQGLPRSAARLLRETGFDALHVGELGMSASSDIEIMQYADQQGRILFTLDSDFHQLLASTGAASPPVVRFREQGLDDVATASRVRMVMACAESALRDGAIATLHDMRLRVRKLPLI